MWAKMSGAGSIFLREARLKVPDSSAAAGLEARVVAPTVSRLSFLSPRQTHGLEFAVGERPPKPLDWTELETCDPPGASNDHQWKNREHGHQTPKRPHFTVQSKPPLVGESSNYEDMKQIIRQR